MGRSREEALAENTVYFSHAVTRLPFPRIRDMNLTNETTDQCCADACVQVTSSSHVLRTAVLEASRRVDWQPGADEIECRAAPARRTAAERF